MVNDDPVPRIIAAVVFVAPVTPEKGALVAAMVPEPDTPKDDPVPTTIAADAFIPLVIVLKAAEPAVPPLVPQLNA